METPSPSLDQANQKMLETLFPDADYSIIFRVALDNGYAPTLLPLLDKIYLSENFSIPDIVMEGIQVLAHAQCENQYCAVFHAVNLMEMGFSEGELIELVNTQAIPERYRELATWQGTLRLVATQFNSPSLAKQLNAQLKKIHTEQELSDLGILLAFCHLDRFVLEYFSDEIELTNEPMITERSSFTETIALKLAEFQGSKAPVVTICSVCKSIKTEDGWISIETAIPQIPVTAFFSHGLCPPCLDQSLREEGLEPRL